MLQISEGSKIPLTTSGFEEIIEITKVWTRNEKQTAGKGILEICMQYLPSVTFYILGGSNLKTLC